MTHVTRNTKCSVWLSLVSVACLVSMYLGMIDIWHGESDVVLEWKIVWCSFWVLVLVQAGNVVARIVGSFRPKNKADEVT